MKKEKSEKKKKWLAVAAGFAAFFMSIYFFPVSPARGNEYGDNKADLYVFYGQGCPHCASLASFLDGIKGKYPALEVHYHEIYQNSENRQLFQDFCGRFGAESSGVPTTFIDDKMIVGFSKEISATLESEIGRCLSEGCEDPKKKIGSSESGWLEANGHSPLQEKKGSAEKLTVPIVIGAAAVDAINPCAFAVLIILMTVALSIADKKRALRFGLAFTVSIYISYFTMGLGLFSALQAANVSRGFYVFVTALAVFVGLMNVKDYFWYGKGFLMEIPLSWRPRMKKIIKSATTPAGAFLTGFAVSLFELPCTGGPYIVILGLLAKETTRLSGITYLLLYNLVFVTPLVVLTIIIHRGISSAEKLEEIRREKIKVLHLVAGIIMLMIAGAMIFSIAKGWV